MWLDWCICTTGPVEQNEMCLCVFTLYIQESSAFVFGVWLFCSSNEVTRKGNPEQFVSECKKAQALMTTGKSS